MTGRHVAPDVEKKTDFTISQGWDDYSRDDHEIWRLLFERQARVLKGRVINEFHEGLAALKIDFSGIPDFRRLSDVLDRATGWQVVAVPGLVPDDIFFEHLANRRFPASNFIRMRDQLEYIEAPDVFHDVFGHVPLLMNEVFANYLQAYGKGGLRALGRNCLHQLARLYWYTVEFGLIETSEGIRIYGSGIVSSEAESKFSLESDSPNRIAFDLERVMRTNYRIDDFQQTYFVIPNFEALFEATLQDFGPIYDRLEGASDVAPEAILSGERVINVGTQSHEAG